jgi:chromosome segregation ATPase
METDKLSDTIKRLENNSSRGRIETNATTSDSSDAFLKEIFVTKLQTRVDNLSDDLFKMENAKEEMRIKNELLEKELMDVRFKNEDLTRKANEARNLKDELDILKQQAEKADKYEQTIDILKKRLEEASDFKRKIKFSGDDNMVSESKLKLQLEDEMRKNSNLKTQLENLKKQVSDLHSNLAQVNHSKDTADFEVRMLKEKFEYLAEEKQFLLNEMNEMRRISLEKGALPDTFAIPGGSTVNLNHELANSDNQNRIKDLERENFILRQKLIAHGENEGLDSNGMPPTSLESSNKMIEALRLEVYDYQQKVIQLEGILQKKEEDISEMEARYRKCVNKAKQVAKVLEPISMTSSNSSMNSVANFEQLAAELQTKDQQLHELEAEHEKTKALKEVEEKLMSVAFHSLAFKLQRSAAEERMTSSKTTIKEPTSSAKSSIPNGGTVSFLARQKQAAARRFLGSSGQNSSG